MEYRRAQLGGISLLLLGVLAICSSMAHARPRRIWRHRELWKESDVVCIAKLGATTEKDNDLFLPGELDRLDTVLKIELIMKGDVSLEQVTFVHFQYPPNTKFTLGNGPTFPGFPSKNTPANARREVPDVGDIQYLFYLKKRPNGEYGPTSGDNDADFSVAPLQSRAVSD
jgi:hypothetical protein